MKKVLMLLVRFYRRYLSGLKSTPTCRYIPTCSEYALQALEKYGAVKGTYLAVRRILRCNPLHKGGYDPVP
ncbi:MAG: membrane protein insertion efficiency factor YidD [Oscillospiraceae bacterium]|nr:membrane protein insertion efficiency factor YidD [Oscillospiraceae bacterium]